MATLDALATAVYARLQTIANATGYWGTVDPAPPTMSALDLRVRPYWVLHTGGGRHGGGRISGDVDERVFSFQVSAVTGDFSALPKLVDALEATLLGWRPFPTSGRCRPPLGYDPGPARVDRGETLPRSFLPLLFEIPN